MRIRKLILSLILVITITVSFTAAYAIDLPGEKDWTGWVDSNNQLVDNAVKTAGSAIVVDINSGRIIYKKVAYNERYPASTTKIMTLLLALENGNLSDMVTVDEAMWDYISQLDSQSTMINVKRGEMISIQDLVYGLMLESGNDAAVVIACHIGGTYDAFIDMMNLKAAEIGMKDTHYVNPHGLTNESHFTTARDMALLAMYAKENYPVFSDIVSTVEYRPSDTNTTAHSTAGFKYINSNLLLVEGQQFYYMYATGIKTGYTSAAGQVFVSSAEYDDQSLVSVIMKADDREDKWNYSTLLFNYAFDFYDTIQLSTLFTDDQLTEVVANANMNTTGERLTMTVGEGEEVYLTEPTQTIEDILKDPGLYFEQTINYDNGVLTAPISQGDQVGTITYKYIYSHNSEDYLGYKASSDSIMYFEYIAPLYAANSIDEEVTVTPEPKITPTPTTTGPVNPPKEFELWQIALAAIGVLFVVLVILLLILFANKGGPNKRYPSDGGGRHTYDDRGGSKNRRRY